MCGLSVVAAPPVAERLRQRHLPALPLACGVRGNTQVQVAPAVDGVKLEAINRLVDPAVTN